MIELGQMVLKESIGYTMSKKDVYPLYPLSGLRTTQQFSSLKLKNHTETAKSVVFIKKLQILEKICSFHDLNLWFLAKNHRFHENY